MFVFVRVCIRFTNKNEQLKIEICINISKKEVKKLDILLKIRGLMKVINRGVNKGSKNVGKFRELIKRVS